MIFRGMSMHLGEVFHAAGRAVGVKGKGNGMVSQVRMSNGNGGSSGPDWAMIARIALLLLGSLSAYYLNQINTTTAKALAQGQKNELAIAAIDSDYERRVATTTQEHEAFRETDRAILATLKEVRDSLIAEREARIRGER